MKQALRDLAALVARVGVGGLFFANGWSKLELGLLDTGEQFARQGAPAPGAWATVTMLTELIGGALLIAGLAVGVTGLILFAEALAVFLIAPPLNPITTNELIALGAAAILLAVVGAGRISVDHMVVIRRRESEAASEFAADNEADQVIASLREPGEPRAEGRGPGAGSGGSKGPGSGGGTGGGPRSPGSGGGTGGGSAGRSSSGSSGGSGAGSPADDDNASEDTAPHARPRRRNGGSDEPAPGDTLVAGRKKPATPRGRKPSED